MYRYTKNILNIIAIPKVNDKDGVWVFLLLLQVGKDLEYSHSSFVGETWGVHVFRSLR